MKETQRCNKQCVKCQNRNKDNKCKYSGEDCGKIETDFSKTKCDNFLIKDELVLF